MLNLAVFVSGGGTDMQSVIDAVENGFLKNIKVKLVVASKPDVYALERAKRHNIKSCVFEKKHFQNGEVMFDEIIAVLRQNKIDLILLAGYLTILTPNIISAFRGKIINIHPSLIPEFCGDGFYGMKVHNAVIAARAKTSGCTVHFVDEGTDTGKIILQAVVPVYDIDTAETLQKRVLDAEHQILPEALKIITE